jgi:hypothetical protein
MGFDPTALLIWRRTLSFSAMGCAAHRPVARETAGRRGRCWQRQKRLKWRHFIPAPTRYGLFSRTRHFCAIRARVRWSLSKGSDYEETTMWGKTRRGTPCQAAAMWSTRSKRYTRCKNHGGMSTGPKTPEGIERIRWAVMKHGQYSAMPSFETRPPSRVELDPLPPRWLFATYSYNPLHDVAR